MSKKQDHTVRIFAAETKVPAWLTRYTNTLIILLMWPCIIVAFVYLTAFYILNCSYGPKILHSQLSGFLRGDYYADTMSTDAFLQTLTMTNVRLSEAGKEETVIFAPKVEAKIPIVELVDLFNGEKCAADEPADCMVLTVNRIKAYNADVVLDFTKGELNILKVVLPYASKPDPPDNSPTNFVTNLADLNVESTAVHLIFDGFRIDLYDTDVDHFALRAGNILQMISPLAKDLVHGDTLYGRDGSIRVGHGELVFNPALFSFALASVGDADEGLIMSGGSGTAGNVGYAYGQMARHLEGILRGESDSRLEELSIHKEYIKHVRCISDMLKTYGIPMDDIIRTNVTEIKKKEETYHAQVKAIEEGLYKLYREGKGLAKPDMRGNFVIPLEETIVDGFDWEGNRFDIPRMTTGIGDNGRIVMVNAMMNVGPTEEEVEAHSTQYHHKRSGLEAKESILWAADLDLKLKVSDPILTYFFGPILFGREQLDLHAVMAGDLARVSGDISLDMPTFETFDVEVARAALRANMDGQHLTISDFEADTALGGVLLAGYYDIMDGNFDLDLWAGQAPDDPDFAFVDPDFRERLDEGMTPMDYFPDGDLQHFGGLMKSHLKAQSQDGVIAVSLPDPILYEFDNPFMGLESAKIQPVSSEDQRILTWQNGVMTSPGGINIDLGTDSVRIGPDFRLNTNNLSDMNADVAVHIENPVSYAEQFGLSDLEADPIDLAVAYHQCGTESCGKLQLKTSNISYMGISIPKIDIALNLDQSKLSASAFNINTAFGDISAKTLNAVITPQLLLEPTKIPFNTELTLSKVDFSKFNYESLTLDPETVNSLKKLNLKGTGSGRITADGPIDQLKGRLIYTMEDVQVAGLDISRVLFITRYEDNKISIPALNVWFIDSQLSDEEARNILTNSDGASLIAEDVNAGTSASFETEKMSAEQAENLAATIQPSKQQTRVRRRTPDLSLGAVTYYLEENRVELNVQLQPIAPNWFKMFRDLEIPLEKGIVAFDISANVDIDKVSLLMENSKDINRIRNMSSTWVEGYIDLEDILFSGMNFGNSRIEMSRSNQFALIRGQFVDSTLELSGFVRTSPRFSASVTLNFPQLDVLKTMDKIGIDLGDLPKQFSLNKAILSGSIGFCMKSFDDMKVSLLLDEISVDVLGDTLELTQTAMARVDLNAMTAKLSQLEFKYRDSVLKMNGSAGMNGDIDFDLNGEIDAAIAQSIPGLSGNVKASSGVFGISLSARGNIYDKAKKISPDNLEITGYFGVRDGIQVLTSMASSPIEMREGFIILEHDTERCGHKETCLYTPQKFNLGVDNHSLALDLFASTNGKVAATIDGIINVEIASLFVKDISTASGIIELNLSANGQLFNPSTFVMTPEKLAINGKIEVDQVNPVYIEMHSMNDPITVDQGAILFTSTECPSGGECIVIPKTQAFKGEVMGGSYLIFGEVKREAYVPKSADLSITANNISFRMKDELSLTVSPDIQITVKDFTNFETVKVAGDIDVAEARYKKNFDDGTSNFIKEQILSLFIDSRRRVDTYSPSFLRKWPFLGKIGLDVGVTAENSISVDVKIATAVVALELGSQLRIGGTVKDYAPTGIVSINQGVFTLRDNDFEFGSGAQVAFNGSLDGKIDITATTEINTESNAFSSVTGNTDLDRRKRISTSDSSSSDLYSITLTVGGSVFKPVWSFESSPYLTDTNVYALILTGKTIEDFSGNDVAMESLLSPFFSSQLDTFINADQFKFVFSEGAAQFVYVKQINKGLRIAAGVSIRGAAGNEQALSAEYYFNDKMYIDLTGQNTSDEEGRAPTFKLGARFHWHVPLQ